MVQGEGLLWDGAGVGCWDRLLWAEGWSPIFRRGATKRPVAGQAVGEGHRGVLPGPLMPACDHFWSHRILGQLSGGMRQAPRHEECGMGGCSTAPGRPGPQGSCLPCTQDAPPHPAPGSSRDCGQQEAVVACLINLTIYSY